jgi:pyruvate dehydrogenase E2 component (dihydrolipoamide acetyltransferase)
VSTTKELVSGGSEAQDAEPATISPRARRVARELGIDWSRLRGTGKTGRIRERDIRDAAEQQQLAPKRSVSRRFAELSSTRRKTAERLLRSAQRTVPVTLSTEVDAVNLVNLHSQFKLANSGSRDPVPSYTDYFVKLTAKALRQHPCLNARWEDDRLLEQDEVNIGIAVDTQSGLLVPVVRAVASLSLCELASRSRDLIERARARRLSASDLQGGSFTVSNLGSFGIDAFTPVINYPEVAILGVGRIVKKAAVVADQIVSRDRLTLSLTFDHCAVDGAPAARFLETLCKMIEAPGPWLVA